MIKTLRNAVKEINKHNLIRAKDRFCTTHNKVHEFTFITAVEVRGFKFFGFDTEKEVINFANELLENRLKMEAGKI